MKVKGMKEFERKMKSLSDTVAKEAREEALYTGAVYVQGQASLNAPVDTGNLRGSIDFEVMTEDATIFTNVEYAAHVEYGTSRMTPQPFLQPAVDNNRSAIVGIFSDVYKKYLTR